MAMKIIKVNLIEGKNKESKQISRNHSLIDSSVKKKKKFKTLENT
jgi:hypothetical protein